MALLLHLVYRIDDKHDRFAVTKNNSTTILIFLKIQASLGLCRANTKLLKSPRVICDRELDMDQQIVEAEVIEIFLIV